MATVQRELPLQTDNFTRGRSFQTAKGPGRLFGRLRGLASPSELCGSGGNAAEQFTRPGRATKSPAEAGLSRALSHSEECSHGSGCIDKLPASASIAKPAAQMLGAPVLL